MKRVFAVLALVTGISGLFAAPAAPPASSAVCVTVTVTVLGNQVIGTGRQCPIP
jgi:hypothetical protein